MNAALSEREARGQSQGHLRGEVIAEFQLAERRLLANPALGLSAAIAGQPGFRPVRECLLGFRGLLQRDEIVEPNELSEDAETDKGRFDDRRHVIENRGRIARQRRDNLRPNDFACNCDSPTMSHPITSYRPDRGHDPSRP